MMQYVLYACIVYACITSEKCHPFVAVVAYLGTKFSSYGQASALNAEQQQPEHDSNVTAISSKSSSFDEPFAFEPWVQPLGPCSTGSSSLGPQLLAHTPLSYRVCLSFQPEHFMAVSESDQVLAGFQAQTNITLAVHQVSIVECRNDQFCCLVATATCSTS
jgi:hypothetical protein